MLFRFVSYLLLSLMFILPGCVTYVKDPIYLENGEAVDTKHFTLRSPQGKWQFMEDYNGVLFSRGDDIFDIDVDTINPYDDNVIDDFINNTSEEPFKRYIAQHYYHYYDDEDYNAMRTSVKQYIHRCLVVESSYDYEMNKMRSVYCPVSTDTGHKMLIVYYDTSVQNDVNASLYSLKATTLDY